VASYYNLITFPIDVWIQRAMEKYYRKKTAGEIRKFAQQRWSSYAGYANTYLYAAVKGDVAARKGVVLEAKYWENPQKYISYKNN
jgi:L-asparagine transporter-like permease